MCIGADGRAVQHLDSTATEHLHSTAKTNQQKHNFLTLSHTVSTVDHTLTAVVGADERVAIVAKARKNGSVERAEIP